MQFKYAVVRSDAPEHQFDGVDCMKMSVNGSGDFLNAEWCIEFAKRFCVIPGRYTVSATSTGRGASPKHDMKQEFTVGPKVTR